MSQRVESPSGLVWNVQKEKVQLGAGVKERLLHVRIRRVPDDGCFIEEIKAAHPEIGTRWSSSVKGLVQASQIQPFNHLYLN